jgi:hypothetical protein
MKQETSLSFSFSYVAGGQCSITTSFEGRQLGTGCYYVCLCVCMYALVFLWLCVCVWLQVVSLFVRVWVYLHMWLCFALSWRAVIRPGGGVASIHVRVRPMGAVVVVWRCDVVFSRVVLCMWCVLCGVWCVVCVVCDVVCCAVC